jgi:hypothetical protein
MTETGDAKQTLLILGSVAAADLGAFAGAIPARPPV